MAYLFSEQSQAGILYSTYLLKLLICANNDRIVINISDSDIVGTVVSIVVLIVKLF